MYCESCGKKLIRGYQFCMECGTPVPPEANEDEGAEAAAQSGQSGSTMPDIQPISNDGGSLVFCSDCGMHMQSSTAFCEKCGKPLGNNGMNPGAAAGGVPLINNDPLGNDFGGISDGDIDRINDFMNGGGISPLDGMGGAIAESTGISSGDMGSIGGAVPVSDIDELTRQLASFGASTDNMPAIGVEPAPTELRQTEPKPGEAREMQDFAMDGPAYSSDKFSTDVPVIDGGSMDEKPEEDVSLDPYAFVNNVLTNEPAPAVEPITPVIEDTAPAEPSGASVDDLIAEMESAAPVVEETAPVVEEVAPVIEPVSAAVDDIIAEMQAAEPAAPVVEETAPVVEPVAPVIEPVSATVDDIIAEMQAAEPAAPVVEEAAPVAPVIEPVAPVVEEAAPVVEPVAPVIEPVSATVDDIIAEMQAAEPAAPVVEEAAPVAPVIEPVAPIVEEAAPVVEEATPVVEPVSATVDDIIAEMQAAEPAAPVVEETAPVVEEAAPVIEPVAPVVEEAAPVVEPVAPVIEEANPVIAEEPVIPAPAPVIPAPAPAPEPIAVKRPAPDRLPAEDPVLGKLSYCRNCGQDMYENEPACKNCGAPYKPPKKHDASLDNRGKGAPAEKKNSITKFLPAIIGAGAVAAVVAVVMLTTPKDDSGIKNNPSVTTPATSASVSEPENTSAPEQTDAPAPEQTDTAATTASEQTDAPAPEKTDASSASEQTDATSASEPEDTSAPEQTDTSSSPEQSSATTPNTTPSGTSRSSASGTTPATTTTKPAAAITSPKTTSLEKDREAIMDAAALISGEVGKIDALAQNVIYAMDNATGNAETARSAYMNRDFAKNILASLESGKTAADSAVTNAKPKNSELNSMYDALLTLQKKYNSYYNFIKNPSGSTSKYTSSCSTYLSDFTSAANAMKYTKFTGSYTAAEQNAAYKAAMSDAITAANNAITAFNTLQTKISAVNKNSFDTAAINELSKAANSKTFASAASYAHEVAVYRIMLSGAPSGYTGAYNDLKNLSDQLNALVDLYNMLAENDLSSFKSESSSCLSAANKAVSAVTKAIS